MMGKFFLFIPISFSLIRPIGGKLIVNGTGRHKKT